MKTTFTAYDDVKWTRFKARHATGRPAVWSFGRSAKSRMWFLREPDGYVRALEETWTDSAPQIHRILRNYDLKADIS